MIYILFLIGAIGLLIVVQWLRGVMSYVEPERSARCLPAGTPLPESLRHSVADLSADLLSLGFCEPVLVMPQCTPVQATTVPLVLAFRDPQRATVVWAAPPVEATHAHRPLVWITSRLEDGRIATSQAFDPYFQATASHEFPGQTIDGTNVREQLRQHQRWLESLGTPVAAGSASKNDLADLSGAAMNRRRQALIQRGDLYCDAQGHARPRWGFGLRLMFAILRRPNPAAVNEPVPESVVMHLASLVQRHRTRHPPRSVQWTLFLASSLIFMLLGSWYWGLEFAFALLLVIAFHELGHYVAMRLFGYRNVHMLMLPMIGGVTIGEELDPNATRRAWMSLMGPLPGIVLGWLLLLLAFRNPEMFAQSWWLMLAMVMLVVNYLNLLPVPPLDGAHVAQALLPLRQYRLRLAFIILSCSTGIVLSLLLWMPVLAVIVALPLLGLPTMLRTGRVAKQVLAQGGLAASASPRQRLLIALRAVRDSRPDLPAATQLAEAEGLVSELGTRPMPNTQRLLIGGLCAALFALPLSAGVAGFVGIWGGWLSDSDVADYVQNYEQTQAEVDALPLEQVIAALHEDMTLPPPASSQALDAAEARLGQPLPAELRQLYGRHDGLPGINLVTSDALQAARICAADAMEMLDGLGMLEVTLGEDSIGADWQELAIEEFEDWLCMAADPDYYSMVLIDPQSARLPGYPVLAISATMGRGHRSIEAWLRSELVEQRSSLAFAQQRDVRVRQRELDFADSDLDTLLAQLYRPGWFQRVFLQIPDWPTGASESELQALEARVGSALDPAHRALLQRHDGLNPLRLLATSEIRSVATLDDEQREDALEGMTEIPSPERCWVIGGMIGYDSEGEADRLWAHLLWCPHDQSNTILDLRQDRRQHADFIAYLRWSVSRMMY